MNPNVTVKTNGDFRRIYRKGRSAVSGGVVVYCLPNRHGKSRLGLTVSTKVGKAVVRNRVRRRFRELYRHHLADMKPGMDILMVARVRAPSCPTASWKSSIFPALTSWAWCAANEKAAHRPGTLLPARHLSPVPRLLPLYPHLLPVCH